MFILISLISRADEGMWLVHLLKQQTYHSMKQMGLRLSLDQLYSETKPSIKDAIVAIDGGSCTGSIVSKDALMLTNFHCCIDDIAKLSSLENNYLQCGFTAKTHKEEIIIPNKSVSFLIKVIDVSKEYNRLSRTLNSRKIELEIMRKYAPTEKYKLQVRSMPTINKHYLFFYKTYKDVRLVFAPPSSIANFGGNNDNFTWPQHKCDFVVLRVYGDNNGDPAEYSINNIPIKPKYVLPVAKHSVKENDFTMIFGYPYKTDRYLSSYKIRERKNRNEVVIKVRKPIIDILKYEIKRDEEVKLNYSSKYFNYSNVYKNVKGENDNIYKYGIIALKTQQEDFDKSIIDVNSKCADSIIKYQSIIDYTRETFVKGSNVLAFAFSLRTLLHELSKSRGCKPGFIEKYREKYNDYNIHCSAYIEKKLLIKLIETYLTNIEERYCPEYLVQLLNKYDYNIKLLVNNLFKKTLIYNECKFNSIIERRDEAEIYKDPFYRLTKSVLQTIKHNKHVVAIYKHRYKNSNTINALYPDANSTMRITHGTVGGYIQKDAFLYDYKTTLKGILEKRNEHNLEYRIPNVIYKNHLSTLKKDLQTCFITNNDITGGNSGSPVLNKNGELVGLAYDGNEESMSGNLFYNPQKSKAICVDITYIKAMFSLN